jgi:DNA-binding CsgD family transcriptional regulator/pimeloyl-ACP methyl ester carboxylesterase
MPERSAPAIRYATTAEGVRVAYAVFGTGPYLVHMPDIPIGIDRQWDVEEIADWYSALAERRTVVIYDPPGVGLSQREGVDVSFGTGGRALETVTGDLGLRDFDLLSAYRRTPNAISFAASHPELVRSLVLWCPHSSGAALQANPGHQAVVNLFASDWKTFTEYILRISTGLPASRVSGIAELARASITRDVYRAQGVSQLKVDATELLTQVACPTLVIHRKDVSLVTLDFSRDVAARLRDARLVLVSGESVYPYFGNREEVLAAMWDFLDAPRTVAASENIHALGLTTREIEVFELLAAGYTNAQIGEKLTLSLSTVAHHISRILGKTGARNRTEAARLARRVGIG